MRAGVVLLAAGGGRRFGPGTLKQLRPLGGRPLFFWPLRTLARMREVSETVLVVPPGREAAFRRWTRRWGFGSRCRVVAGGATRNESVCRGVRSVSRPCEVVLVHDAARPLVSPELVRAVMTAAARSGASLAALPVRDTLKKATPRNLVRWTVPRNGLWMAQTPQGFRAELARRWFSRARPGATDDVQVMEQRGVRVKLVQGSPANLKVTYPEDWAVCRSYFRARRAAL